MELQDLKSVAEAVLFVSGRPLTLNNLAKILEQQPAALKAALDQLVAECREAGVVLLENNGEYQMATNSKHSTIVKNFLNADLREKLTDATVEVLAIIAYRQPISKNEIEAIRGVNSQYSLRVLLMRGMVEKIPNPRDARGFLYQTSTEFLQHLGLISTKDLPEFEKLVGQIKLPIAPQIQSEIILTPAAEESLNVSQNEPLETGSEVVEKFKPEKMEDKFEDEEDEGDGEE